MLKAFTSTSIPHQEDQQKKRIDDLNKIDLDLTHANSQMEESTTHRSQQKTKRKR